MNGKLVLNHLHVSTSYRRVYRGLKLKMIDENTNGRQTKRCAPVSATVP
jgi:hypothetical protein